MARIFGTAGIRGRYPDVVSPQLAFRIGLALAAYLGGEGRVVVGHDSRTTSPLLAGMASSGLLTGGVNVVDIGVAPTPVVGFSVVDTGSRAGVVVTASHNPPEDNGVKVFGPKGSELTSREESALEEYIASVGSKLEPRTSWEGVGRLVGDRDVVNRYKSRLVESIRVGEARFRPRIVVDCANGPASDVTPHVIRDMGAERIVSFNCHKDGRFPGRHPEPRPDTLKDLIEAAFTMNIDMYLAHDGDADRLAVAVPGYGFVKQDLVIALIAWWKLRDRKGSIIVSVDVGNEVVDIAESMGGRVVRSRLGKIHEKLMEHGDALMAAEPWKLIDPSWGLWVDGIYKAALITRIVAEEGVKPSKLLDMLPFYPSARISIALDKGSIERVYELLVEEAVHALSDKAVEVTLIDGVRLDFYDGSWMLLRKSGTEPKIRLYAQARDSKGLKGLVSMLEELVKDKAGLAGASIRGVERHISLPREGRAQGRLSPPS